MQNNEPIIKLEVGKNSHNDGYVTWEQIWEQFLRFLKMW